MATDKLITMKQFNGTDYDTLYPKTIASQIPDVYSKTDTITANTLSQFGLSADKLPNDAFQQIKALIDGKPNIQTGSYVGTGTYGVNNPCSLTFGFSPSILIISGVLKSKSTSISGIGSVIMNISYGHYGESYAEYSISGIVEKTENQVQWYSDNAASEQMNTLDSNYYYIALG